MPRQLSAKDNPSDNLTMSSAGLAAFCFIVTLLAGVFTNKMLMWKGDKLNLTAMQFAAGVTLGTAMMDLMSVSDAIFHDGTRFEYPMAFLMFCVGYVFAMLVECLLARAVRRILQESFESPCTKRLDAIMFDLGLQPTKYCDFTLPLATSKSETKDGEDSVDYDLENLILYRTTLLVDGFYLCYTFAVLSAFNIAIIKSEDTKAMGSIVLHSIVYVTSIVFTIISLNPVIVWLFVIAFPVIIQGGIITAWIPDYFPIDSSHVVGGGDDLAEWIVGTYTGFSAGVLVYMAVNHMLVGCNNYNELERPVSDDRFGKFVAVAFGVGAIAFLKVLEM